MLRHLTLCFIAINISLQACDSGCLRCNVANECQICDVSRFLKLDAATKTCVKATADNCLFIDLSGLC